MGLENEWIYALMPDCGKIGAVLVRKSSLDAEGKWKGKPQL